MTRAMSTPQQLRERALAIARSLNDLAIHGRKQQPENPEYLRGQIELIADLFGDGNGEYTDAKYTICNELGVVEL